VLRSLGFIFVKIFKQNGREIEEVFHNYIAKIDSQSLSQILPNLLQLLLKRNAK